MSITKCITFLLLLCHAATALANRFPERPITLVCGFAAGAAADSHLRALAKAMSKVLGQPIVVDNKPGASGAVAASIVANTPPDGYTLIQVTNGIVRQPFMTSTHYDPLHSFTYLIGISAFDFGLVVNAASPWKTFEEFIAFGRQQPEKVSYGTIGVGSAPHLVMEQISRKSGTGWTHVAYKGSAPGMVDLQGGHVTALSDTGWAPMVDAGKVRVLAVYRNERLKRFPHVPTLRELGYDIVEDSPWGLATRRGVPADRLRVLHDAARRALEDPDFIASLEVFANEVRYQSTEQYQAYMAARITIERDLVERYKLRAP